MSKRSGKLLGEYVHSNPVEAQRKKDKAQQRKRQKFLKANPGYSREPVQDPSEQLSLGVENRAAAWKSVGSCKVDLHVRHPVDVLPGESLFDPYARLSVYYDPVSNPSGRPPSCKPAAYRHPDGVIRPYPPRDVDDSDSSSSESYSRVSSSDESPAPVRPVPIPTRAAPPRPVTLVTARPPPRPTTGKSTAPLLPRLESTVHPVESVLSTSDPVVVASDSVVNTADAVASTSPSPQRTIFVPSSVSRR